MNEDLAQAARTVVEAMASYGTHPEAETAVGLLADRGFPVAGISIASAAGARHFSSVSTLAAGRYDVMAPFEVAAEARRLLAQPAARRAA